MLTRIFTKRLIPRVSFVHLFVLLAVTGAFAQAPPERIERLEAAAHFAQVRRLSEQDGGRL